MELPNKPSELILVALHDLELCEADKNYKIDMGDWHAHNISNNKCYVCLAGAVMAKNLDVDKAKYIHDPDDLGYELGKVLDAIDALRCGRVHSAFHSLDLKPKLGERFNRKMSYYSKGANQFKLDMTMLAFDLWEAGY